VHYSGPLLEWFESEQPDFLERIQALVARKQVELIGGGFYEPIFSMLREPDILGQIQMMTGFIQSKFDLTPAGIWLAERVWDPSLPRPISQAGLKYTLLDSTHFLCAGMTPEQIHGYYVTEKDGHTLLLFPIDMTLRYAIPFEEPEKTIAYLQYRSSDCEDIAITYGDDGEKFGVLPGTHSWVYKNGWLEAFFRLLEKQQKTITMELFSDHVNSRKPHARIYLPTISYEEMMEWALPADTAMRYIEMLDTLDNLQLRDKYSAFIRGGYWNNFLVKYPESNIMHKKMLQVSEKLEQWEKKTTADTRVTAARRELYQGQCNCPYWHGLFGGIYLNYLRHAVFEHLITAEHIIDTAVRGAGPWIECRQYDFTRDMAEEVLISASTFNAYFAPVYGGALFELDFKPRSFNLTNVMSRRMEAYHRKLKMFEHTGSTPQERPQPLSIHELSKIKDKAVQDQLFYDWFRRYSFLDHFLGDMTTLEYYSRCQYAEQGDFVTQPYTVDKIEQDAARPLIAITLSRQGTVWQEEGHIPVTITKQFSCDDRRRQIEASYTVKNESPHAVQLWFGIECNFCLLAGSDPLRYYYFPSTNKQYMLNSIGQESAVEQFDIKDEWTGMALSMGLAPRADVWRFPLETVSQSEDGIEKTYQGSSLLAHWKMSLDAHQEQKLSLTLCLNEFPGKKA
jgi:alpha-amylase